MKAPSTEGARTSDWVKQGLTADIDQGELFERAFRHAAIGMALVNLDGCFLKVNDALCQTLGYSREQLMALAFRTITHPADLDADLASRERLLTGETESYQLEKRYLHRDGREIWSALSVTLARAADGAPRFFICQIQDITAPERELRHTKLLLEETIANIEDGVVLLDAERNVVLFNRAYSALFGLDESTLRGMGREQFLLHVGTLVEDPSTFQQSFAEVSLNADSNVAYFTLVRPTRRVLRRSARPVGSASERLYLIVWHDVTIEHDRARDQERAAHTDALTGLRNRRAADEALPREVSRAERAASSLCAVMMDIDHFKRVNDSFGHAVGDSVLRHIADAIQSQARSADLVARWGGEEFVAILASDRAGARLFAERVRVAVEALELPQVGRVTISAGIAEYATNGSGSAEQLLADADARLYEAKAQGRNRVLG
jgi:diguanylate cyclase (GGDEF)-like protein/PAS domain S-box-containing protein